MTTVYPFNFRIGPLNVTGYGIMLMVGFLVGGWLMDRDLRSRGLNNEFAADITVAAVIGGVLGAKLWFVFATGDIHSLLSRGGLVWYGGFIGGALVVLTNGLRLKVPLRWTLDISAPALPAAYALGRIGCFLVGDDYGIPTKLPWGVQFPQGLPPTTAASFARDFGVPIPAGMSPETVLAVHPTQLYEAIIMTGVFMVLWRIRRHSHARGWLFGVYLVCAGMERFLVEFLRAKEDRLALGLTLAQVMALSIVVLGGVMIAKYTTPAPLDPGPYLSKPPSAPKPA